MPQPYPHGELVVVIDCSDLDRSAAFWSAVLGYTGGQAVTEVSRAGWIGEKDAHRWLFLRGCHSALPWPEAAAALNVVRARVSSTIAKMFFFI